MIREARLQFLVDFKCFLPSSFMTTRGTPELTFSTSTDHRGHCLHVHRGHQSPHMIILVITRCMVLLKLSRLRNFICVKSDALMSCPTSPELIDICQVVGMCFLLPHPLIKKERVDQLICRKSGDTNLVTKDNQDTTQKTNGRRPKYETTRLYEMTRVHMMSLCRVLDHGYRE